MKKKNFHSLMAICMFLMAIWGCFSVPETGFSQGTQTETLSLTVDDAQIEKWIGRENRMPHPVVAGLESRDESTLHFYFSKSYGQRAQGVIATAKSAREKTLRFLPAETVENIHVYLLGDINQYFDAVKSDGRAPEWAAGLTLLRDGVILIRLSSNGTSRIEPERTLAHELNHAALRRYSGDHYFPHWFYEGLAMTATDDWNLSRAEAMGKAAMSGQLLDLQEIDAAFGKTGTIVDLAYAESAHFVSWLAKTHGDEAVKKLIEQVASGTAFDEAFKQNFERTPEAACRLWLDSISREESLLASIFSHDGIFFMISVFAAFGLCVALWRRSGNRKRRLAAMNKEIPDTALPENLRNFGPFQKKQ